jgi:hypothetical protein
VLRSRDQGDESSKRTRFDEMYAAARSADSKNASTLGEGVGDAPSADFLSPLSADLQVATGSRRVTHRIVFGGAGYKQHKLHNLSKARDSSQEERDKWYKLCAAETDVKSRATASGGDVSLGYVGKARVRHRLQFGSVAAQHALTARILCQGRAHSNMIASGTKGLPSARMSNT